MELVLTAAIICGTIIFLCKQAQPYVDRTVGLFERRITALEQEITKPSPPKPVPPPLDLVTFALGEATPWAQEDALKRLHELGAQCNNDWGRVRELYVNEMAR